MSRCSSTAAIFEKFRISAQSVNVVAVLYINFCFLGFHAWMVEGFEVECVSSY